MKTALACLTVMLLAVPATAQEMGWEAFVKILANLEGQLEQQRKELDTLKKANLQGQLAQQRKELDALKKAPAVTVQSGAVTYSSNHLPNFNKKFPCNQGSRSATKVIRFPKRFSCTPKVTVGMNRLDASHDANLRINTQLKRVRRDGFDVSIQTWCDSRVYSVGINWVAHCEE